MQLVSPTQFLSYLPPVPVAPDTPWAAPAGPVLARVQPQPQVNETLFSGISLKDGLCLWFC